MRKRDVSIGSRTLSIETGRLAKQADGSVVVRLGDTMVLVTACHAASPREGIDFLPLTVDYREYTYASGRIPGGFFKREGKPTEKEVLTSRLIDRPIRPLFPPGWRFETQVIALVLSADTENDSDVLAITGASAALAFSEIPFHATIAGVRVGLIDNDYIVNPTYEERKRSKIDLIVAGSRQAIVMVEAGAKEATEDEMVRALEVAHVAIREIVDGIDAMAREAARTKLQVQKREIGHDFYREVEERVYVPLSEAMRIRGKLENYERVDQVLEELIASLPEGEVERRVEAKAIFKELKEKVLRDEILERGTRLDGRRFDEIRRDHHRGRRPAARPRLRRVHPRGDAGARHRDARHRRRPAEDRDGRRRDLQALHAPLQLPALLGRRGRVPPRTRAPGSGPRGARRALAHAARPCRRDLPVHDAGRLGHSRVERIVLDGVGLRRIAGDDGCGRSAQVCCRRRRDGARDGREVAAGSRSCPTSPAPRTITATWTSRSRAPTAGITALQMDIKVTGITTDIMRKALEQARQGRLFILEKMREALSAPRTNISTYAPRIVTIKIPVDKIRDVIGPGGKMIRSIIDRTGVKIDVEDDGRVNVASVDEASAQKAIAIIQELTATPELNKTYMGKVQRITEFGAFVEVMPGVDGLLHVSEIAHYRVKDVRDELKEGEQVMVKVINIDPSGKIRLSRKALLPQAEGEPQAQDGGGGGHGGGGGGRREHVRK